MTMHTVTPARPRTWYPTLAESRFGSHQVLNADIPMIFRLRDETLCHGPYWQTSSGAEKTRQHALRYFALPATEELRDWIAPEISKISPSGLLDQFNLAIAALDKVSPEMAGIGLRQLCRTLVGSKKDAVDWSGAAKLTCVVAFLRDIGELLGARGIHELNTGRNRVIADSSLWQRKDLGVSFVQAIAQAIHEGKLHRLDVADVTLAKLHRAWNLSWFGENESPGWFLLLWATETGNLAVLWPAIRAQVKLLLAQSRVARAINKLDIAAPSQCAQ